MEASPRRICSSKQQAAPLLARSLLLVPFARKTPGGLGVGGAADRISSASQRTRWDVEFETGTEGHL